MFICRRLFEEALEVRKILNVSFRYGAGTLAQTRPQNLIRRENIMVFKGNAQFLRFFPCMVSGSLAPEAEIENDTALVLQQPPCLIPKRFHRFGKARIPFP